jgi:uncharacterized protein YkvS
MKVIILGLALSVLVGTANAQPAPVSVSPGSVTVETEAPRVDASVAVVAAVDATVVTAPALDASVASVAPVDASVVSVAPVDASVASAPASVAPASVAIASSEAPWGYIDLLYFAVAFLCGFIYTVVSSQLRKQSTKTLRFEAKVGTVIEVTDKLGNVVERIPVTMENSVSVRLFPTPVVDVVFKSQDGSST